MRGVCCALVLLLGLLTGCAPGTPDADSWRDDAARATGDVLSEVATVRMALGDRDRLFATYLQTVLVGSEETASAAAQRLSALQPPSAESARHDKVTTALEDAASLLTDVRTAVLAGEATEEYAGRLASTAAQLDALEQSLHRPAPAAAAGGVR